MANPTRSSRRRETSTQDENEEEINSSMTIQDIEDRLNTNSAEITALSDKFVEFEAKIDAKFDMLLEMISSGPKPNAVDDTPIPPTDVKGEQEAAAKQSNYGPLLAQIASTFPIIAANFVPENAASNKTLTPIAGLVIDNTYEARKMVKSLETIIHALETANISFDNYAKAILTHLAPQMRNSILSDGKYNRLTIREQYDTILCYLFQDFPFTLYQRENINQLMNTTINAAHPLKFSCLKFLDTWSHSNVDAFIIIRNLTLNFVSAAEPTLPDTLYKEITMSPSIPALRSAIRQISDTTKYMDPGKGLYKSLHNPRFDNPGAAFNEIDAEFHAIGAVKTVRYTCQKCNKFSVFGVPYDFLSCVHCGNIIKKGKGHSKHAESKSKQGYSKHAESNPKQKSTFNNFNAIFDEATSESSSSENDDQLSNHSF